MLSKNAYFIVHWASLIWLIGAGIYSYKAIIHDFMDMKKQKQAVLDIETVVYEAHQKAS